MRIHTSHINMQTVALPSFQIRTPLNFVIPLPNETTRTKMHNLSIYLCIYILPFLHRAQYGISGCPLIHFILTTIL